MKIKTTLSGIALTLLLTLAIPFDILGQEKEGPPSWAPAHGYRAKTNYVYFPDHNFYFDIEENVYIYMRGEQWQVDVKLPSLYAWIDLKGALGVELELTTDSPQKHNVDHIIKYKKSGKEAKEKGKTGNQGKGNKKK